MNRDKVILTEKQEQCVRFKPEGSLLVRGIPGSGKSTILLARAQYLRKNHPNESLVILTFSRPLTNYVKQLSLKTGEEEIEAKTFHQWAQTLIKETDYPHTRLKLGADREEVVRFAINIIKKNSANALFPNMNVKKNEQVALVKFLSDEIEWIKGSDIKSRTEYMDIKRSGRGTKVRVTKQHRDTIYDVLEKYNELLKNHRLHQGIDSEDLARIIIEKIDQIPQSVLTDHILVDEAQDLHSIQLRSINIVAQKSLTIGADKGQQIFRRTFTWKKAGIEVLGNRSRFLDETFRSTKQIVRLANNFQENDHLFTIDEEYIKAKEPEIEGKIPELFLCDNKTEETEYILYHIKNLRASFPEDTIGVIINFNWEIDSFKTKITDEGIPVFNLRDGESDMIAPGVKLITYQSSKGLEFDHVIVTGLKEGKIPYKNIPPGEDEEEFLSRERKKFYVAMTRAKKTLLMTASKPYSPFIFDLDTNLYKIVRK
ncbi:3'-5' exonuclease [Neobacillus sp. NPDC058068]|uniref:3'-5' exonuclease n=1 Tax=Neobacillus sp. NPDC058068 TaxID=3346325 RepID=UPI0036DE4FDB